MKTRVVSLSVNPKFSLYMVLMITTVILLQFFLVAVAFPFSLIPIHVLSGALAVLDISLLGLQIIINLFCVLPPVSVIYRHVITFLKCIHYFSSKTSHYFSHGVQGNLHCTHVMVYTDHCTFTKVGAIYSLAFIINELVI